MIPRLAALFLALVLAPPASAKDFPALYRVTDVAADDVLNIRAEPHAGAEIVGSFAPGASGIEVVALSESGTWGLVNTGEGSGWSSMHYLSRMDDGNWRDGEQFLHCFGTEPFWSLRIFLPTHRAEMLEPDHGGFELVTDTGALPTTQFPPTLAIPFSGTREGVAVVRGGALCWDGMSDRTYGLEALLYWRRDTQGLSGCCTLAD